ncbi:hypothetical protein F5Y17DRAFT_436222 [Xylariaceae sp. FL0594]|nr:hypothetical protein F5Y17DRAFT_436222 [Xylariaceae sp. FL0594]
MDGIYASMEKKRGLLLFSLINCNCLVVVDGDGGVAFSSLLFTSSLFLSSSLLSIFLTLCLSAECFFYSLTHSSVVYSHGAS